MVTARALLLCATILGFFACLSWGKCPFSEGQGDRELPRGHNKPFGHHAKAWKRIHTVFEHPEPQEFYNDFLRKSRPLVIKGGAKDWPAIQKWKNISYINELGGKERSDVNWRQIYDYDRFHPIRLDMSMSEFTQKMDAHNIYMDATILTGMHDDVHWPHSLGCQFYLKRVKQLAILMNNGKSRSYVHTDVTDTFFMQTTGRRLWLLSPPKEAHSMYSGDPHLVDHSTISILNQTHTDLEKHSALRKVPIYAAFLHPGDIIYVPESWFHQVSTDGSPNIAIVAFLNVLFCEYAKEGPKAGMSDAEYLNSCVNTVLQKKPKKLECNPFPRNMTVTEVLKTYKPRTLGAFKADFENSFQRRVMNYVKRLPGGSLLPTMGMTLTGMSPEALKAGQVLKQGLIEGYRFFCTAPGDGSEEALAKYFGKRPQLRQRLTVLSYLPVQKSAEAVRESIKGSLAALKTDRIDIVLMKAPYCVPDYSVGACTRNAFTDSWAKTWAALEALQAEGKIRFLGVSDFSLQELKELKKIAKSPIAIARARFDVYFRNLEFRHFCKNNSILFMGRSVLGRRWKVEQPDFPMNRDIFKEYRIQRVAYKNKISIHAATYDYAVKKNMIIAPKVNDPIHTRVNIKAIDSESVEFISDFYPVDQIDPNDKDGLSSPHAIASDFSFRTVSKKTSENDKEDEENEENEGKKDKGIHHDHLEALRSDDMKDVNRRNSANYSEETYTDEKDFEVFPSYMLSDAGQSDDGD